MNHRNSSLLNSTHFTLSHPPIQPFNPLLSEYQKETKRKRDGEIVHYVRLPFYLSLSCYLKYYFLFKVR